jgi:hypothetical protein
MRITKKVTREVEVTEDYVCNKCGESCRNCSDDSDWEGLIEVGVVGGYGSAHLGDGNQYEFSLCEACLVELFQTFMLSAKVTDTISLDPGDDRDGDQS